jgi:hypothetical protein
MDAGALAAAGPLLAHEARHASQFACCAGLPMIPATGNVVEIVDARRAAERHWGDREAVMNGIAALPRAGEFLLTGKIWRHICHVRLTPPARIMTLPASSPGEISP